jgi:spore germination protein GerM
VSARAALTAAAVGLAALLGWALFVALPHRYQRSPAAAGVAAGGTAAPAPGGAPQPGRKIKVHLYYVSDDGTRLVAVEREIPYGDTPVEQARQIVEAQIAPPAAPVVSAIPPGTRLRALFVTDRGEAYVDLTHDVVTAHTGGSLDELLTVYTLVDALTTNLPGVASVQILIDGREVDTLAGHVDLRRPLAKNTDWIQ